MFIIGIILCLVGGAMIETPIVGYINHEYGLFNVIAGIVFGALFLVPGVIFFVSDVKERNQQRKEKPLKDVIEALKPGFKEVKGNTFLDRQLADFREHYSAFFKKERIAENEEVQKDVTQIFRNIMQLQKERLNRFGLTSEILMKRMAYTGGSGLSHDDYTDGKYNITDVTEQVAAKTIYRKSGKPVYTKIDKELANYTIIQARKVGDEKVICPNCGAETTRDALLDGCDYCGTKFKVEDLGSRIAVFAFRPDEKLRYEKYARSRNYMIGTLIILAIVAVFVFFTVLAVINGPSLLEEADGGIILTTLASLFSIIIAAPVYILSFLVVYFNIIFPIVLILGVISYFVAKKYRKKKNSPMLVRGQETAIRKSDPNFSIANFYSSLQNKISSVVYAENKEQIQAFAEGNLTGLLGKFSNVVGMDVDRMEMTDYRISGNMQHAAVDVFLFLTRYNGKTCKVKKEKMTVKLRKDAACKTQVVCAPAVMRCGNCGASLDLFRGKQCEYCKQELDLTKYDWAIDEIML